MTKVPRFLVWYWLSIFKTGPPINIESCKESLSCSNKDIISTMITYYIPSYCVQTKLGFLFDLITFSQRIRLLKPSMALWILKLYGFSLSYPSIRQPQFGLLAKYICLHKCFLRLSSTLISFSIQVTSSQYSMGLP